MLEKEEAPMAADAGEQHEERSDSPTRFVDGQDTWEEELAREAELARQAVRLEMEQQAKIAELEERSSAALPPKAGASSLRAIALGSSS